MDKDVKYINNGLPLDFDPISGFAINPESETAIFGADFRNLLMGITGTGTVIVYGTLQKIPPDFAAPATITNFYVPIALVDLSLVGTPAYIAGATGLVVAGASKMCEINTDMLTWFGIHRSAETVDVLVTETNNQ